MAMDIQLLSADMFSPHIGSEFLFMNEAEVFLTLQLVDCRKSPRGTMPGTARTAFSMLFEIPVHQVLPGHDGFFTIRHDIIGEFGPVHVARVISTQPEMAVLEVIFN